MKREIPKKPAVPRLNNEMINALSMLCFREDNAFNQDDLDTVFVFGTAVSLDKASEIILELTQKSSVKKLVLTGGSPTYHDSFQIQKAESLLLYDLIEDKLPKHVRVFLETKSHNCQENVTNSLEYLQESGRIALVTKNFGMSRHYLTFKKHFPDKALFPQSFAALYPESEVLITNENWYQHESHISRVWGEFLRIKSYGTRGDIIFDEVKHWVDKIDLLLQRNL
ncbi:MAG: YdcF family protein [Gammaproteobacteria bacterium]|nr:YdcF family protein [Gammaproteobacteria bacterium]